jgi:hypothetical protein
MNLRYPRWLSALGFAIFLPPTCRAVELDPPQVAPEKVLGVESCAKCHDSEIEVWRHTPHHHTFRDLHRLPEAKAIAQRMGTDSIKQDTTCVQCHYTRQGSAARVKAVSGVSCESCHGAARDWIALHHDYGGPHATRDQESPQHRQARVAASVKAGMRNPHNLYLIARSCFQCHTTPHEALVNVGGHVPGSLDFELVAWSQGSVRHNFVRTNGKQNDLADIDRLRVMFVAGVMTDLEFSLRATALSTQKAHFGITSAKRANTRKKQLEQIQARVRHPLVQQVVDAVSGVRLTLNNKDELLSAADQVSELTYRFAEAADGSQLSAVDSMLPSPQQYK